MNIFKIKASLFSFLSLLLTFFCLNYANAQCSYGTTSVGVNINSQDNFKTEISIKGSSGLQLGYITANKNSINKRHYLSLRDKNDKPIITSVLGVSTSLNVGDKQVMFADTKGRVVIGDDSWNLRKVASSGVFISENNYKLFVEKGIVTEKVKCAIKTTGDWSDYVFEEDYEMMPIDDLEGYVTENKHLPNVPSAEEMVENGLDVAKMDAKLLEKIEEAYLYIIDMNKEMKTMNEKVDALANENGELKASLSAISTSGK